MPGCRNAPGYRAAFDVRSFPAVGAKRPYSKGATPEGPAHVARVDFTSFHGESNVMITGGEFFLEFGDYLENRVTPEVRKELELHVSQSRVSQRLYDSSC